jgi:predicted Zn finger-like uncharacterized protein
MALATTCPLCKTSFKVVPDQLKLSRGSVRCGVCQNVFSGIDHLRYVDQSALKGPRARPAGADTDTLPATPGTRSHPASDQSPTPDKAAAPVGGTGSEDLKTAFFLPDTEFGDQVSDALTGTARTPHRDRDFSNLPRIRFSHGDPADQGEPPADTADQPADRPSGSDPLSVVESGTGTPSASVSASASASASASTQDHGSAHAISDLQQVGDPAPPKGPEPSLPGEAVISAAALKVAPLPAESIDFGHPGNSQSHQRQSFALTVVALLLIGLLMQALIGWRNDIAARSPQMSAALEALLGPLGLKISPPLDLSVLSIESFELQTGRSADVLQMTAILRNRSSHVVSFPAMELTLTDSSGALLSRKVIQVDSYLDKPLMAARGLAGRSEWPLRIALEHDGLAPAGYSVALFYP